MVEAEPTALAPAQSWTGEDAPDWLRRAMLFFALWIVLGGYSDTWAHHHYRLTSIFTPFHGVVFSGLICEGIFLAWTLMRLGAMPAAWRQAIPRGYGLAIAGYVLAMVGGALDLTWHFFLGIDQGFGSVTSPTHIMIGGGTALMVTGPLREAWAGTAKKATWSALLSATLTFAMIFFFDEATHPLLAQWASNLYPRMMLSESAEQIGTIEIVLWAALITGCVLPLILRFEMPFGGFTLVLGTTGALTTLIIGPQPVIVVGLIGGLVADELNRGLRPTRERRVHARAFAFLVPVVMTATYFFILSAAGGVWWPVNIWAGCITASGVAGLLVSVLVLPGLRAERPAAQLR